MMTKNKKDLSKGAKISKSDVKKVDSKVTKKVTKDTNKVVPVDDVKVVSKKSTKVAPVKKIVVKETPKKKEIAEKEVVSSQDESLLLKSYELVKKLGGEIQNMHLAKEGLRDSLKSLEGRVLKHEDFVNKQKDESRNSSKKESSIMLALKEEVLSEFAPIIEKLNLSSFKKDFSNQINKLVELESSKLKSELDLKNNKARREITKKLSDLEVKLVEIVSSNNELKKDVLKNTNSGLDAKKLEEEIRAAMLNVNKKFMTKFNEGNKVIEEIKLDFENQKKKIIVTESRITKLKNQIDSYEKQDGVDMSSIISKIAKLEKENSAIKSLIEKYENDLYSKNEKEKLEIDNKIKKTIETANKKVEEVNFNKKEIEDYVDLKISQIDELVQNFEERVIAYNKSDIGNFEKKTIKDIEKKFEEVMLNINLKIDSSITELNKENLKDKKELSKFRDETTKFIDNYVDDLNKEIISVKKTLEKNFGNKFDTKLVDLRKTLNKEGIDLKKELEEIKLEGEAQKKYFVDKYNSIIKDINIIQKEEFEKSIALLNTEFEKLSSQYKSDFEKQVLNNNEFKIKLSLDNKEFSDYHKNEITKFITSMNSEFEKFTNQFKSDFEKQIVSNKEFKTALSSDNKEFSKSQKTEINKSLTSITKDFEKLSSQFKSDFEKQIASINEASTKLSINNKELIKFQKDEFNKSVDLLSKEFEKMSAQFKSDFEKQIASNNEFATKLSLDNKELIKFQKDEFNKSVDLLSKEFEKISSQFKSDFAKQVASNNEFATKLSLENKEELRRINEAVDTKLVSSSNQYDEIFNKKLEDFEVRLESEERNFLDKLSIIEKDKDSFLEELVAFKDEIGILTKDYIQKMDEELQKIKVEEFNFNNERSGFFTQLNTLSQTKKIEIQEYVKDIEEKLYFLIDEEKRRFDNSENSFRESFTDKISNLNKFIIDKLDNIEKKFVDKNLKYVKDELDREIKIFEVYEQKLKLKEEELEKQIQYLEESKRDVFIEMEAEHANLNSKIEERQVKMEQSFNKRFLDYDSKFGHFKGVVIDEVEDVIKEVNQVLMDKIMVFDSKIMEQKTLDEGILNRIDDLVSRKFDEVSLPSSLPSGEGLVPEKTQDFSNDVNFFEQESLRNEIDVVKKELNSFKEGFIGFKKKIIQQNLEVFNIVQSERSNPNESEVRMSQSNRLDSINSELITNEIQSLKSEIKDTKIKMELMSDIGTHNMSEHVRYMSDYENQLVDLIKSLKSKNFTAENIKEILSKKGHPRFYVSMILNNFDMVYN